MTSYAFPLVYCLLVVGGCQQSPPPKDGYPMAYTYQLRVDETNPMTGVEKRWQVQCEYEGPQLIEQYEVAHPYGYLFVYSKFWDAEGVQAQTRTWPERIPQDTLIIPLTRTQMDTVYQLSRRVFTLPPKPKMLRTDEPPPPPAHDLDSYLVVDFELDKGRGPHLRCSGYGEENYGAYWLQDELKMVEKQHLIQQ